MELPMYGYEPRKRPELGALRVTICESQIAKYLAAYPSLSREEVLVVMITAGPMREAVEKELDRVANGVEHDADGDDIS
jgi:hypothetical protein